MIRPKILKNQLTPTKTTNGNIAVMMTNWPISPLSPWAARNKWPRLAAEAAKTVITTKTDMIETLVRRLPGSVCSELGDMTSINRI